MESNEVVEFGPFRPHLQQRKLFCASERVELGSRAMDVLLALARNKGALVSKDQLFEAAWPNAYVHESNLKVTVAASRRRSGAIVTNPRFDERSSRDSRAGRRSVHRWLLLRRPDRSSLLRQLSGDASR